MQLATLPRSPIHTPTARQIDVLRAIVDHRDETSIPPTFRDLGHMLGLQLFAVVRHVEHLVDLKLVHHRPGVARSIRLTPRGRLLLAGFQPGIHPAIEDAVAVDRASYARWRCSGCHQTGVSVEVFHRIGVCVRYALLLCCPQCGEEAEA